MELDTLYIFKDKSTGKIHHCRGNSMFDCIQKANTICKAEYREFVNMLHVAKQNYVDLITMELDD